MPIKRLTTRLAAVPLLLLLSAAGVAAASEQPAPACATGEVLRAMRWSAVTPAPPVGPERAGNLREELTPDGHFLLRHAGAATQPAAVAEVARTLDAAWRILVGNGGWPDPAAEGPLEVNLIAGRAAGDSRAVPLAMPGSGPDEAVPAALVVAGAPLDWPLAALHQFLHAVQLAASGREQLWAYEATALALEDRLLGGGLLDPELLEQVQAHPGRSLLGDEAGTPGAAAPFLSWLAATHGDALLARWWRRAAREWDDDTLAALDTALRLTDLTPLDEAWREFTVWSAYPRPDMRPAAGGSGLAETLPATAAAARVSDLPASGAAATSLLLEPLGHGVLRLADLEGIGAVQVELQAAAGAVPAADALVRWPHVEAGWLAVPFRFTDGVARLSIPLEPGSEVAIIVRDHRRGGEPLAVDWRVDEDPGFPFELSFLAAEASPGGIDLTWGSESERGMFGWLVYRATDPRGPFLPVGSIPFPALGEASGPLSYHFVDAEVRPGTLYYYLVEGLTLDGLARRSPVVVRRAAGNDAATPLTAEESR